MENNSYHSSQGYGLDHGPWYSRLTRRQITTGIGFAVGGGIAAFISQRYRVANAAQYIVRTGLGIPTVSVTKKAVQWPFQTAVTMSMNPRNYTFSLQAMSKEKMEFVLPGSFTIGPQDTNEALCKYVTLLSGTDISDARLSEFMKGIIEGETRVLAASMDIEEIFDSRDKFRQKIVETVQFELGKFGLLIYNANVKELEDASGSEYFVHARQRKRADAEHQARRDIADAKYLGDVGVKEKDKETRIKTSQFQSDAVIFENARTVDMAESRSKTQVKQWEYERAANIAKIEAQKAGEIRDSELQKDLEQKRIAQETERLRSTLMTKAAVEAEARERTADAGLYVAKKEAEAIQAKYDAQAEGLRNLLSCADPQTVLQYSMIDRGIFQALAAENAKAIHGLAPKIWVTGESAGAGNAIGGIMRSLPPLLTTLYEQTGIRPPKWAVDMENAITTGVIDTNGSIEPNPKKEG